MKLGTSCKQVGLFNDVDLFATSQRGLGICVCFFFGTDHWAGGVESTAADVWAVLYVVVLVRILVLLALKLTVVLADIYLSHLF